MEKIKIVNTGLGLVWFGGWLFTIGYLHLRFFQGLFALVLWPYDIGAYLSALHH